MQCAARECLRVGQPSFRYERVVLPTPIADIVTGCLLPAQKFQSPSCGPAVAPTALADAAPEDMRHVAAGAVSTLKTRGTQP